MSKIGRKSIDARDVKIDIKGRAVHYSGKKSTGTFEVPELLEVHIEKDILRLVPATVPTNTRERSHLNRIWGLNYALLKNKIFGAKQEFEVVLQINGLGYKVVQSSPRKLVFSLGKSHKIDFDLPAGVTADIDSKTGQRLALKSSDNVVLGQTASQIRALRPPEPYKGTGIKRSNEVILRKPGKTKSS